MRLSDPRTTTCKIPKHKVAAGASRRNQDQKDPKIETCVTRPTASSTHYFFLAPLSRASVLSEIPRISIIELRSGAVGCDNWADSLQLTIPPDIEHPGGVKVFKGKVEGVTPGGQGLRSPSPQTTTPVELPRNAYWFSSYCATEANAMMNANRNHFELCISDAFWCGSVLRY